MNAALLIAAWLAPLLVLALRNTGRWWTALAVLPALTASVIVPVGSGLEISWLLLGTSLELDHTGQLFMFYSALLWLFAALYAELTAGNSVHRGRFRLFFLLSMAGNMLLILAADMMIFYSGFALMGLAAYGMVVQRRSQRARYAGRVYLAWTLAGELALFSAVVMISADIGSQHFDSLRDYHFPGMTVALLVFGFGIKLALPGLHFWLPVTYANAPTAAAAVLSGPLISAGLLGWLRFLPADAEGLDSWAAPLQSIGIIGILLATLLGLLQNNPRALLGYSSILKMGLITAVFGTALGHSQAAAGILAALSLYALHHSLVKGALFIGVGEWQRAGATPWMLAGLGVLALALMGAPLSGGAAAKVELKQATAGLAENLGLLLLLSTLATALLLGRFFWLITRRSEPVADSGVRPAALVWLMLVPMAFWLPYSPLSAPVYPAGLIPIGFGLGIVALVWSLNRDLLQPRRRPASMSMLRLQKSLKLKRAPVPVEMRWVTAWRPEFNGHGALSLAKGGLLWLVIFILILLALTNG
jgi:formate hydrogenlyase subunit 3/multisubunit Na+/H+ antiporter MnhD subunit